MRTESYFSELPKLIHENTSSWIKNKNKKVSHLAFPPGVQLDGLELCEHHPEEIRQEHSQHWLFEFL